MSVACYSLAGRVCPATLRSRAHSAGAGGEHRFTLKLSFDERTRYGLYQTDEALMALPQSSVCSQQAVFKQSMLYQHLWMSIQHESGIDDGKST